LRAQLAEQPACQGPRSREPDSVLVPKIYAHRIDGQADAANKRITDVPGVQDTGPESEPGDEEDDNSERAS
jgi:hypothetical protein